MSGTKYFTPRLAKALGVERADAIRSIKGGTVRDSGALMLAAIKEALPDAAIESRQRARGDAGSPWRFDLSDV